jgi:type IV secretion system protein VirB4
MPVERDGTVRVHRALTSPEAKLQPFGADRDEVIRALFYSIFATGTGALAFGILGCVIGPIYFIFRFRTLRSHATQPLYYRIYNATKDEQRTYGPRAAGSAVIPRNRWRLPSTYIVRALSWKQRLSAIFFGLEQDQVRFYRRSPLDLPLFGLFPSLLLPFAPGLPTGRQIMMTLKTRAPRFYRDWSLDDPAEALEDRLPWRSKPTPTIILNRQATFTRSWRVFGPDFSGKDIHDMNRIVKNPFDALITNGTKPGFVVNFDYEQFPWERPYDDRIFPTEAATLVNEERRLQFEQTRPFNAITEIHLTYIPHMARTRDKDLDNEEKQHESDGTSLAEQIERDQKRFEGYAQQFEAKLKAIFRDVTALAPYQEELPSGRSIRYDAQLESLWRALTGRRQHIRAIGSAAELYRFFAQNATISQHRGTIRFGRTLTRVVQILDYPDSTMPDMFAALENAGNIAIRGRFIRDLPSKTTKAIDQMYGEARQAAEGDPVKGSFAPNLTMPSRAAEERANTATLAMKEHQQQTHAYGYTSIGIFVYEEIAANEDYEDAHQRLIERSNDLMGRLDGLGFRTDDRTGNELERLLGCLPGNTIDDVIRPMLSSRVFVNLITTAHPWLGDWEVTKEAYQMHDGRPAPPLAIFPTNGQKPFAFSPINSKGNGNTLIVGDSGAGKSGFLALCVAMHSAYTVMCKRGARQIVLDKDGSHLLFGDETIGNAHIMQLAPNTDHGFAPFYRIDERDDEYDGLLAAETFIKLALKSRGHNPNDYQTDIDEALVWLKKQPPKMRTSSAIMRASVSNRFRDIWKYFTTEGGSGNLFEGTEPPQFSSDFIILNQSFAVNDPALQRLVFWCVTELIETMLRDGIPTIFATEEAWEQLNDEDAAEQYDAWSRRVRKFEFQLWLVTHSIDDIEKMPNPDGFLSNFSTFVIMPTQTAGTAAGKKTLARINLDEADANYLRSLVLDENRVSEYIAYVVKEGRKRTINYQQGPVAINTVASTSPQLREDVYEPRFKRRYGPHAYREWIRTRAGDDWAEYLDQRVTPIFDEARAALENDSEPSFVA